MHLKDKADSFARLGLVSDKARDELSVALDKWFAKWFVKGIKLATLRELGDAQAYDAFERVLRGLAEAEVIAIVRKVDPENRAILSRARADIENHIRALAEGRVAPHGKISAKKNAKNPAKVAKAGGVLATARQG